MSRARDMNQRKPLSSGRDLLADIINEGTQKSLQKHCSVSQTRGT